MMGSAVSTLRWRARPVAASCLMNANNSFLNRIASSLPVMLYHAVLLFQPCFTPFIVWARPPRAFIGSIRITSRHAQSRPFRQRCRHVFSQRARLIFGHLRATDHVLQVVHCSDVLPITVKRIHCSGGAQHVLYLGRITSLVSDRTAGGRQRTGR